jgi:hypothetical protein
MACIERRGSGNGLLKRQLRPTIEVTMGCAQKSTPEYTSARDVPQGCLLGRNNCNTQAPFRLPSIEEQK